MAGNNGNDMRSIESSKSSIPSQDCNEAVTSSSATPPAAACHWPVQHRNTTMLMTQIYVEYVSYWMTQHVYQGLKHVGKCQIFVALFDMGLHQREMPENL